MPTATAQLLSDGIGVNSSSEESRKLSSSLQPINDISLQENDADHTAIEQERIYRINGVRERLSPLIERLKDSVTNIQTLEKSMRPLADGSGGDGRDGGDCESRKLMNESMEMVKKKMFRLKIMEEELAVSEDRRVNLHHYFRQQAKSVQTTATEAPSVTPTGNCEYQNRIMKTEEEICLLKQKSLLVDDLQVQNARLLEKTNDVKRLENDLEAEKSLRSSLESNLHEHQYNMNRQAVKYDSLEYKFEVLTSTSANLKKGLQAEENSNMNLEQNIMDTMSLHRRYLSNSRITPRKIEDLGTNESFTLTEPMTSLSWTESSISNDTSTVDENDDSDTAEQSPILDEETTSPQCTVEILRAKIESLNRENAELRESKSRILNKYKSLHEEMI